MCIMLHRDDGGLNYGPLMLALDQSWWWSVGMAKKEHSPAPIPPLPPPVQKVHQHTVQEQHPGFGKLTSETKDVIKTQQNLQVGRLMSVISLH